MILILHSLNYEDIYFIDGTIIVRLFVIKFETFQPDHINAVMASRTFNTTRIMGISTYLIELLFGLFPLF